MSAGAGEPATLKPPKPLEKSFAADGRVAEVVNNDALQYTNKLFRDFYSGFYTSLVRSAPNFLGWWYKTTDEPWQKQERCIPEISTEFVAAMVDVLDLYEVRYNPAH